MARHTRRRFLRGGLALAGLGLLSGCGNAPRLGQPPARVPRVGFFHPGSESTSGVYADALRQELGELGWVEGRNIALDVRWADGRAERLPELAAELVRQPIDVLVAGGGTYGAQVATQATSTIPIVMVNVGDPLEAGLIASFSHPGGNVTGLTNTTAPTGGKRLDLLREVAPGIARVDFLWNPATSGRADWAELELAAGALRVAARSREVRGPDELDGVFGAIAADRPDGLIVHAPAALVPHARRVADFAADLRLPAIYQFRDFVEVGGLMAYGVSLAGNFRRAAAYVDKILKGAKPADLPVEQPAVFDFVINLNTARTLGLTIPQSVLQQVTEVIQ